MRTKTSLFCLFLYSFPVVLIADETANSPLYIIFDGSNSMWGELPDKSRKIAAAKDVFNRLGGDIFNNREVALRLYGHRRAGDCSDTELVIPFTSSIDIQQQLAAAINAVSPRGKTPISRSFRAALDDFAGRSGEILLISDGVETCDADPCELVKAWREREIDIRIHVVGLGLDKLARDAMQCISDTSGTTYMDANSVEELSLAIERTSDVAEVLAQEPLAKQIGPDFKISAVDENGDIVPVAGTLSQPGRAPTNIASNHRYVFEGGKYTIEVGVPTANGELYSVVSNDIQIKNTGPTRIQVILQRPPKIKTKFLQNDEEVDGVISEGYIDGVKVFELRPSEDYFVMPGRYEFKANANKDNANLTVAEIVTDGDDKTIVFDLVETVHVVFNVIDQVSGKKIRQNQELWQNGKLKYKVHVHNGARVEPGTYQLISNSFATPYVIENVRISAKDRQILEFSIPFGKAQISYRFHTQPERSGRRCWLYRVDVAGNRVTNRSPTLSCDGSDITLVEGKYLIRTWSYLGEFEETIFNVTTGQSSKVDVRQK